MIRYDFVEPPDALEDGKAPMRASVALATDEPAEWAPMIYQGHSALIERVRGHLRDSFGTRGSMIDVETRPFDLIHAKDVGGQLDDYEPRRTVDTVKWPKRDEA